MLHVLDYQEGPMVAAVPVGYLRPVVSTASPAQGAKPVEEYKSWRLAPHHLADVRDVARGVEESAVGICTKYLLDQAGGQDGEVSLNDLERFCKNTNIWERELGNWRDRLTRCRRAFNAMRRAFHHTEAAVLHVVYGHPDPFCTTLNQKIALALGELLPLARYTDAVEDRRKELARVEASRMAMQQVDDQSMRALGMRHGIAPDMSASLVDLVRHRERYEWALRVTSSADALRAACDTPLKHPGEPDESYKQRKAAADDKRAAFIALVQCEADRTLTHASKTYHRAWLTVGPV